MTKEDYKKIAEIINDSITSASPTEDLIDGFVAYFFKIDPNFDEHEFREMCFAY